MNMEQEIWFHGKISREKAEHMLRPRSDGTFLVRESVTFPGEYVLCLIFEKKLENYRIKRSESNKFTIDDDSEFFTVTELIAHYKYSRGDTGIVCNLKKPLRKEKESSPVDKDITKLIDKLKGARRIIEDADLTVIEVIDHGDFGQVVKGDYRGEVVAIKTMLESSFNHSFLQEAYIMCKLRHRNIVMFKGVRLEPSLGIVVEYMAKGSLVKYLRSHGRGISRSEQIQFAVDSCDGMVYLESMGVVHRDLAARNILLSESLIAKVSDFGLALSGSKDSQGSRFPIKWSAPEAVTKQKFTSKADVWSFGILLWEIFSFGRIPYPRIQAKDVIAWLSAGNRMSKPDDACPDGLFDLMLHTWELEASKRPKFSDLAKQLRSLLGTV